MSTFSLFSTLRLLLLYLRMNTIANKTGTFATEVPVFMIWQVSFLFTQLGGGLSRPCRAFGFNPAVMRRVQPRLDHGQRGRLRVGQQKTPPASFAVNYLETASKRSSTSRSNCCLFSQDRTVRTSTRITEATGNNM